MIDAIPIIELTEEEQKLYDAINWDIDDLCKHEHSVYTKHFKRMGLLAKSLFKRKVIPARRMDWFTKKELNIGGRGKSRCESFLINAKSVDNMVSHPCFMAYLRYFIFGPVLPRETITGFVEMAKDKLGILSASDLSAFVRKEIRDKKLLHENTKYSPADEFFKLALEVGCDYPDRIYRAAKSVRRK